MTSPFVPLHVTPYTESLSTTSLRALEWLLSRMAVAMDPQTARSTERLAACLANVSILTWWERRR